MHNYRVIILGAAGFVGTNLTKKLLREGHIVSLAGRNKNHFEQFDNVDIIETSFDVDTDYESLLNGFDVVYHLISTTQPTNANQMISAELVDNVIVTTKILDACVKVGISKIVFISSGGTVYGKEVDCPIKENDLTNPISSYGLQKLTIEKLLYLYNYVYGLDYRVFRLSNPYGPYQRPDGRLGAVTTFLYKALRNEPINVYGDGSVIRDYIYIDDAIDAIYKASSGEEKLLNIGSGRGTDLNEIIRRIEKTLGHKVEVNYQEARTVDVPVNFLDVSKYEDLYGPIIKTSFEDGMKKTIQYLEERYIRDYEKED